MLAHRRRILVPSDVVWDILADGWLYPLFVVGTTSMRAVDADWPAVGSRLHHAVGAWPLLIRDTTVVRACEPGRRLELVARGWPLGEALVVLTLTPTHTGSRPGAVPGAPAATFVTIEEDAIKGPGAIVPHALRQVVAWVRNGETLRRLDHLARGRAGIGTPPGAW